MKIEDSTYSHQNIDRVVLRHSNLWSQYDLHVVGNELALC